jgi:uncharacterized protein
MSEREQYQSGVPCWVDTVQPEPEAAVSFYGGLFGWSFSGPGPMPGDPPGRYFAAQVRGREVAGIGSQPANGGPSRPAWNTYISVERADEAARKAKDAGGDVVVEPFDVPPAGRMAVLTDPAGALFCVWEAAERNGARLVNEPGAWSMSFLGTDDPEGAMSFYGSVFGWNAEPMELGGQEFTLCRLPGYVGGEPQQPVPRDVVAVMLPANGGAPDGPPQWNVDFWVGDADAAADKASKLGGEVVVGPYDTPGFRQAVLADPHGATFTVSQLLLG